MSLKIIGIGMPRTGTASLCEALRILGYNAIHHAPKRIDLDTVNADTFAGLYDDVDAVLDMPAAYFYQDIALAYPNVKFILTTRYINGWWESMKKHADWIRANATDEDREYADRLHAMILGTARPNEYLWKRRFHEWNNTAARFRDNNRSHVLDLDVFSADPFGELSRFLNQHVPFPHEHKGKARYS